MRERFEVLNPVGGSVCGPGGPLSSKTDKSLDLDASAMEFVRGGIARIVALFEGYVQELLREAFTAAILDQVDSLQEMKNVWPNCQKALQGALIKRSEQKKSSEDTATKGIPLEVVAFNVLLEQDGWRKLTEEHLEKCLKKITKPLFDIPKGKVGYAGEDPGIDATFKSLFLPKDVKFTLSGKIIDQGITMDSRTGPGKDDIARVTLRNAEELRNVARLFYGIRCVFAHGDPERTFKQSLHEFPPNASDLLENKQAADFLMGLYKRVSCHYSDADVSYLTWVNMTRFFRTTAEHLFRAMASYIYDSFVYPSKEGSPCKLPLWGHPPNQ